MDPVALHVTTARLRRRRALPRDLLIQLVQADLHCASDDAIAHIEKLISDGYLVESTENGTRVVRRGPRASSVTPSPDESTADRSDIGDCDGADRATR